MRMIETVKREIGEGRWGKEKREETIRILFFYDSLFTSTFSLVHKGEHYES
jgi:hypothetical protein